MEASRESAIQIYLPYNPCCSCLKLDGIEYCLPALFLMHTPQEALNFAPIRSRAFGLFPFCYVTMKNSEAWHVSYICHGQFECKFPQFPNINMSVEFGAHNWLLQFAVCYLHFKSIRFFSCQSRLIHNVQSHTNFMFDSHNPYHSKFNDSMCSAMV